MLTNQLASKYAQALYKLAAEQETLDAVKQQLVGIRDMIDSHSDLAALIYHPRVPVEAKKDTIQKVFASEISVIVRNFLFLLIDNRREVALPSIIEEFIKFANEEQNIAEAMITTAFPLNDAEMKALAEKLSKMSGKNIITKPNVDKSIIGGVIVKIGDKLIDGSVARQLKNLQAALLKSELNKIGVTN